MKTKMHFLSYLTHFFLECEMFQTKLVEKFKTHIMCSVTFFLTILPFMRYVEKCCKAGQATHDNMAHAVCMLDT